MNKKPKILVVGSFVMDQIAITEIFPREGQTVLGKAFRKAPGGKGANQAVQAARLGANVTMIGKVGHDRNGEELLSVCKEAGICTSNVIQDADTTSGCAVVILEELPDKSTHNRIIVIPGANMDIREKEIAALKDTISSYDMVMLQLEIPIEINELIAQYAYEQNVPVMLNPAPSTCLSEHFLSRLTYISPNEHEAEDLTGIHIRRSRENVNMEDVRSAALAFKSKGVKNVIITLGSGGVAMLAEERFYFIPCVEDSPVADPTAAGDSFVSAFCVGACCGWEWEDCLHFANHTATLTVSAMGAIPSLPGLAKVKSFMEERSRKVPDISSLRQDGMDIRCKNDYDNFLKTVRMDLTAYADGLDYFKLEAAANLIASAKAQKNRLHISGIGKPGHIAGYLASLFSSTGTPAYFLHGTEAVHGSCGQLLPGDVVIFISNSGETAEMRATVTAIKNNGCKVIGVTGIPDSWLAKESDIHLFAGVPAEGGPLNRAPRTSILAEMLVLQALSVILQSKEGITPQQYVKWHPGGKLGQLRNNEVK